MQLTQEQERLLGGEKGEAMSKVVKTLIMYGDTFGATQMIPVTGTYGHIVTSVGVSVLKPYFVLMQQLIDGGAVSERKFTADPRPLDKKVPANLLQKLVFKFMYGKQEDYEKQLSELGLISDDAFSCTCYLDEIGNIPQKGDILSWAESSAVVYANSVLGARCNRNSGIIELFGNIAGFVPYFGLLTDEGRKAKWIVKVKTDKLPEAQLLGSAIGMCAMEDVPYIRGLDRFLGTELDDDVKAYLKDMGAATASNGAVGLYHVENLTPEAVDQGEALIAEGAQTYVIDDQEIERIRNGYPCIWKDPESKPRLCFIGCPHLSLRQLRDWTSLLTDTLKKSGRKTVFVPTVFLAAPAVAAEFLKTDEAEQLKRAGVTLSSICPLMFMNNPMCAKMPVITNSNKLRTYSSARYYTDDEILGILTKGASL